MEIKTTKILGISEDEMLKMKSVRFYRNYIVPEIKKAGSVEAYKETELSKAIHEDKSYLKQLRNDIYNKTEGNVYGTDDYIDYKNAKKLLKLFDF